MMAILLQQNDSFLACQMGRRRSLIRCYAMRSTNCDNMMITGNWK